MRIPTSRCPASPFPALLCLAALASAGPGLAQADPTSGRTIAPQLPNLTANVGMHEVDGELWAVGASYKARFDATGVMIVPDLGAEAPRSLPLWLGPASARRGGAAAFEGTQPRAPFQRGMTAVFERGPHFEERFEARVEGLEQSFLLRELPAGEGDLVVRFDYTTELTPRPAGAGLSFDDERGRGLSFGAVTGIDADGSSISGRVVLAGNAIELVLPADFVATARLPLLVDPLIGGKTDVFTLATVSNSDASYDLTTDSYLVVFQRDWSAIDHDVYGQRITPSGLAVGGLIQFETSVPNVAEIPAVGNCNDSNRWLVVWRNTLSPSSNANIVGCACDASSGTISAQLTLASSGSYEDSPDVSSDIAIPSQGLIAVWTGAGLRAARVSVPATGAPTIVGTFTLSTSSNDANCKISNSQGQTGSYAVVFERLVTVPVQQRDIHGVFLNAMGAVATPLQALVATPTFDEQWPQIDGDGTNFALVYTTWASSQSPTRDLVSRELSLTGSTVDIGPESLVDDSTGLLYEPTVAYTGTGYIAGWKTSQGTLRLAGLDAGDASLCEQPYALTTGVASGADLAPQFAGGSASDDALATFNESGIRAQRLEYLVGGSVVDLGGGCGSGGIASLQCAPKIGSNLRHKLTNAAPSKFAFLLLGLERADLPCGPCTVVPSPFASFIFTLFTNPDGTATFVTPIKPSASIIGLVFYEQWLVDPYPETGGSCAALDLWTSTSLQVTVQ
jgi:hypothetical protein